MIRAPRFLVAAAALLTPLHGPAHRAGGRAGPHQTGSAAAVACSARRRREDSRHHPPARRLERRRLVIRRVGGRAGAHLASLNAQVAEVSDSALDALTADPGVRSVHLDRPLVSLQSTVTAAPAPAAAARAARTSGRWDGSGVGVALIDSGVVPHRDLGLAGANDSRPRLVGSVDFVNGRTMPYDDFGHGTHVAGIIGGDGTDSDGAYAGVAPGTKPAFAQGARRFRPRHDQHRHSGDRLRRRKP